MRRLRRPRRSPPASSCRRASSSGSRRSQVAFRLPSPSWRDDNDSVRESEIRGRSSLRRSSVRTMLNKVPEVTLYFWIIKILCTTVGETAADFLNDNLGLGLTNTTWVMSAVLAVALVFQFRLAAVRAGRLLARGRSDQRRRHADHRQPDRQLRRLPRDHHGRLRVVLAVTFAAWYASEKTLSIHTIYTTRREAFYWLAVLFTFALGTAAGDLDGGEVRGRLLAVCAPLRWADRRGLRRPRALRAQRRPRILARLHPDAAARGVDRRLPVAAPCRRRPRARHDRDERTLPRHDLGRGRLPVDHQARSDRVCSARRSERRLLAAPRVLVVANKTAATPALIEAVRERAAAGPAEFVMLVPNPAHLAFDRNSRTPATASTCSRRRYPPRGGRGAEVEGRVAASPNAYDDIVDELAATTTARSSSRRFPATSRTGCTSISRAHRAPRLSAHDGRSDALTRRTRAERDRCRDARLGADPTRKTTRRVDEPVGSDSHRPLGSS